jgi:hypothetical protein
MNTSLPSSSSSDDDDDFIDLLHGGTVASVTLSDDDDDDDDILLVVGEAAVGAAKAAQLSITTYQDIILPHLMTESPPWGGSKPGKSPNKDRDFDAAYNSLVKDYFSGTSSVYNEVDFERRFRLPRSIFNIIYQAIINNPPFVFTKDCTGKNGIHPLNRMVACLRHLAYGRSLDADDEYLRLSESSVHVATRAFVRIIKHQFGTNYLNRNPTDNEKKRILSINKTRGFPGLFASWDCSHYNWVLCPVQWHGAFKGRKGPKSIILEAVVDYNLRIWYSNFGSPGSMNDINVLDKSTILQAIVTGSFDLHTPPYNLNGTFRDYMYFLVDGIYPKYAIFQSTGDKEGGEMEKLFSIQQEGVRKDVERVFAVLNTKFQILQRPFRGWEIGDITDTVEACIILHNMVVEKNVNDEDVLILEPDEEVPEDKIVQTIFNNNLNATYIDKVEAIEKSIEEVERNHELKIDIMEHMFENIDTITKLYEL